MIEFELVLPCYNESKSLNTLITRAKDAAINAGYNSTRFQLILVENGSLDDSRQQLESLKLTELGSWFRIVRVEKNQGYGFGLWSGLSSTEAPMVGWSHADQQCDPADAFVALEKLYQQKSSNTIMKGIRRGRNWKDKMVSHFFEFFAWVFLGLKVSEINAQPKVFSRSLLAKIKSPPNTFAFDLYVLYCAKKAGYHFKTIPVLFPPRIHGVSNWASNFLSRYKTILGIIQYMYELSVHEGRI